MPREGARHSTRGACAPPRHAVLLFAWRGILHVLIALLISTFAARAADALAQIQIQGGGQLQIQGGGKVIINGVQVQAGADAAVPDATPPVIFFPGIPSVLVPNPAADARPAFMGMQLDTSGDEFADDAAEKKDAAKKIVGVGILNIVEGSPAEKAGLKEGDTVLTFEGREAKNSVQLRTMIRAQKVGKDVKITVRRDGKEIELKAKLAAAPEQIAGVPMLGNGLVFNGLNGGGNEPQAVPGTVVFNRSANFLTPGSSRSSSALPGRDTVLLRDGNRFAGKIRGFVPAKGLLLQREGAPDLELIEEEITGLTFAEREPGEPVPAAKKAGGHPKVMLQMRDGSVLYGDALTMEQGTLALTLQGEQRVKIPRERMQTATLSDEEGVQIFDGPSGLAGWSSGRYNQGQWEYKNGLLRCITNGAIGRDLGRIPDPLDMSFDIVFPRQMQHFGVSLFSSEVNVTGVGALTLQFSPAQIFGNHFDGKRSNQYNTALPLSDPVNFSDRSETVRYRLLVDRVKGAALIYINGVKRAEWKLSKVKPEDIGKCGASFSITPHVSMSNATFQIGRVRLLPWNGKEPAGGAEPPEAKGDTVLSGDGTLTEGAVEKITAGEIRLANPGATVRRDRTIFVRFAAPAAPGEMPAAAATVRMKNGGEFSATQVRGDGTGMTFATRFGTEITLPFSALGGLDFLPRAAQGEASAQRPDVLTLTDGTQIRGHALMPIAGGNLRWKIAASKAPLEYPSANVAGIFFSPADDEKKGARLKGGGVVRLANGDWLPGDVVSLDAKRAVVANDLAAELSFPVSDLRGIYMNADVAASVGDGASGSRLWSEGWMPNRSALARQRTDDASRAAAWTYFDGGYTPTAAARTTQAMLAHRWPAFAGAYAMNLEIANGGRSPSVGLQLYNSKDERTFSITMNGGRVYVFYNPGIARMNRLGAGGKQLQVEGKGGASGETARIGIVLDRPAKAFRVFMEGREIGKMAFKADEAAEALDVAAMSLTTTSYSSARGLQNRVARVWLAPWDGPAADQKKDAAHGAPADAKDAPAPVISLVNGDEFSGTVEKISSDAVTVNSDAGPLELPGRRVAWIRFPGDDAPAADHFPRLRFHDSGVLSVREFHIEGDRMKCETLNGQALDFPLGVVKEAVWRPIAEK